MGVESVTTGRGSRNRIGACTCGLASWADLAVRVVRGRIPFIPPLAGVASQFSVCLTGVWPRMKVPGEWMMEESYATLNWSQLPFFLLTKKQQNQKKHAIAVITEKKSLLSTHKPPINFSLLLRGILKLRIQRWFSQFSTIQLLWLSTVNYL